MFLVLGLLLGCTASVAVAGEKPFVYHKGYESISKEYVDKLRKLHPAFNDICSGALKEEADQSKDVSKFTSTHRYLNLSIAKSDCDKAVLALFEIEGERKVNENLFVIAMVTASNLHGKDPLASSLAVEKILKDLSQSK